MADKQKVLKGFECHRNGFCFSCPYNDDVIETTNCKRQLVEDAIELLKEQEAVKPLKNKLSFTHGFDWEIWDCGCCGNQLRSFAKYCDQCGQAVKWDG